MSDGSAFSINEWNSYFIYLIVLLAGVACLYFAPELTDAHWSHFVSEMGTAMVIAIIIVVTVERVTRKQHKLAADKLIHNINDNLFHAVYDRYIPDVVFAEVDKCLLQSDVYRTNYEVYYSITNWEKDEDDKRDHCSHVKCNTVTKYTLENITCSDIEHVVMVGFELPIDSAWHDDVKVLKVSIDGEYLSEEAVKTHSDSSDGIQLIFRYPKRIPKGGKANIRIEAQLVKRHTDMEVWASTIPSDGLKLMVSTPDQDIDLCAHANHSENLDLIMTDNGIKTWELKYGILPHQSVSFWWSKKVTS